MENRYGANPKLYAGFEEMLFPEQVAERRREEQRRVESLKTQIENHAQKLRDDLDRERESGGLWGSW